MILFCFGFVFADLVNITGTVSLALGTLIRLGVRITIYNSISYSALRFPIQYHMRLANKIIEV